MEPGQVGCVVLFVCVRDLPGQIVSRVVLRVLVNRGMVSLFFYQEFY